MNVPLRLLRCLTCLAGLTLASLAFAEIEGMDSTAPEAPESAFDSGYQPSTARAASAALDIDLGTGGRDPYKALVSDMIAAPGQRRAQAADGGALRLDTSAEDTALFYEERVLDARIRALKSSLSSVLGKDPASARSDEERELELQNEIALDAANRRSQAGGNGPSRAERDANEAMARKRLYELMFLAWDTLTHPVTITLAVLFGLGRLGLAILRVARDPNGKGSARRSSSQGYRSAPPPDATADPARDERDPHTRSRRHRSKHRSYRHRSRRSLLDRIRSI